MAAIDHQRTVRAGHLDHVAPGTLEQRRAAQIGGCDDRPASRDTRELEAEAVAFFVCQAIGLDVTDAARDYIHLYRGD